MKHYYFVGEVGNPGEVKILGFNLTKKEKDELFYNKKTPSGGMTSIGNYYGSIPFKIENVDELEMIFKLKEFKNNKEFSYIIVSTENKWLASGFDEDLKTVLDTIRDVENDNPHISFYVYEITKERLEVV